MNADASIQTKDDVIALQPAMPVRRLHNYAYCPRLFYYQWVENIFIENADTIEGTALHRQTDKPSRLPQDPQELDLPEGAIIRSLYMESQELGLVGKIDVCEGTAGGLEVIDYKKGHPLRGEEGIRIAKHADAIQVAAYALILNENGQPVIAASIYYAAERKRVTVPLDESIFQEVRSLLSEARNVAAKAVCPPPLKSDPRCLYCSAYPVCLPSESAWWLDTTIPPPKIKEAPRVENELGEVLVVQNPRAYVGQRGDQIVVTLEGTTTHKLPIHQVRAIYLYGAIQISSQLIHSLLEEEISVSYFSAAGRFLGLLGGLPASGVDARRGQYRLFEQSDIRLLLARETIRAKISNQRVMLMRNGEVPDRVLRSLADARDQVLLAPSLELVRGIEGGAASIYFEQFATMIKSSSSTTFDFAGRNKRPPRDPVNALLSLGYSMLAKEITGVCYTVGLDPFLGFFHQPRYGRPALALDLMEEFRPLIADSVAVSLINRGELVGSDFIQSATGTFLNERGRRTFWEAWFRRLDSEITHPEFGYRMSYRRMLEVQARQLWRFVRGEALDYHGFTTR
ncbi:MAG: CRISPR-associated endonuclease Cas1 [Verrucomicrobia bacterium]|nr:CRISPR-associated endonuclease Cas1 [Verrucomicrobiota bacterium]